MPLTPQGPRCTRHILPRGLSWAIAAAWRCLPRHPETDPSLDLSSDSPPQLSFPGSPSHMLAARPQLLGAPHAESVPSPQHSSVASLRPVACSCCLAVPGGHISVCRVPGPSQRLSGLPSEALGGREGQGLAVPWQMRLHSTLCGLQPALGCLLDSQKVPAEGEDTGWGDTAGTRAEGHGHQWLEGFPQRRGAGRG